MDRLRKWLCRVGIHQYNAWVATNVDLIPAGGMDEMSTVMGFSGQGVDMDSLMLETQVRRCRCCSHVEVRQFVKW